MRVRVCMCVEGGEGEAAMVTKTIREGGYPREEEEGGGHIALPITITIYYYYFFLLFFLPISFCFAPARFFSFFLV